MTTREYQCNICRHVFERQMDTDDAIPSRCPQCGAGKLTRLLGGSRMEKGAFARVLGAGSPGNR